METSDGKRDRGTSSRLGRDAARDLCRAGGCAGFLAGAVAPDGTGYGVTVEIYHDGIDAPIVARSTRAASEDDLLNAIHALAIDLRQALGESPDMLIEACPPTTRSLAAFEALARVPADTAEDNVRLAREALQIDPDFTDAYKSLGDSLWDRGDFKGSREAWEQAYRRSSNLPRRCSLKLETGYLAGIHDHDAAVDRIRTYMQLYPSDPWGPKMLAIEFSFAHSDLPKNIGYNWDAYRLNPRAQVLQSNLSDGLMSVGEVDDLDRLAAEIRGMDLPEAWSDRPLMFAAILRNDAAEIRRIADRRRRASLWNRQDADYWLLVWLFATGRLNEVEDELPGALRAADQIHDRRIRLRIELMRRWLVARRGASPPSLSDASAGAIRGDPLILRLFASNSVDTGQAEPLASWIETNDLVELSDRSRYVRDTLAFARGCLALVRGEPQAARDLLEPLAAGTTLVGPHRMLGLAYENLGLDREAAHEYEEVLQHPYLKWDPEYFFPIASVPVLLQYRLARLCDRFGDTDRARHRYEAFAEDWKDADPDIPELIEARKRLAALGAPHPGG